MSAWIILWGEILNRKKQGLGGTSAFLCHCVKQVLRIIIFKSSEKIMIFCPIHFEHYLHHKPYNMGIHNRDDRPK